MANILWLGHAPVVAQVDALTPGGTIAVGNTFTVTCNGKAVTYIATDTTVASVCTGLAAALTASEIPEFTEIAFADGVTAVTATSNAPGTPFTVTASKAQGAGGTNTHTFTRTATTTNSGPSDINIATNYNGSTLPTGADTIICETSSVGLLYNLHLCVADAIKVYESFSGSIGLPEFNPAGYHEYRSTHLFNATPTYYAGTGARAKFQGLGACSVVIINSAGEPEEDVPCVNLTGFSGTSDVTIYGGTVGISWFAGQSSTGTPTVKVIPADGRPADLYLGAGVTPGNVTSTNCKVTSRAASCTQHTLYSGSEVFETVASATTVNNYGGTYHSATNITTYVGADGSTLDLAYRVGAKTVTNCTISAGATINDPQNTTTFTNGIVLSTCTVDDVTLTIGTNVTITPS